MAKISTEKDVFLRVAKKRGVTVERVEEIYDAFIKGLKDKIEAEDKMSVPLKDIGTLVMNKSETKYYLKKGKVLDKEVDEISSPSLRSLKKRYNKMLEFLEDFVEKKQDKGIFSGYNFLTPFMSYKAIHFYTSFKYHRDNFKGRRYLYTLKQIEKKIEEIFYAEDNRHNKTKN